MNDRMNFVPFTSPSERYTAGEVIPRDRFYYKDSTQRIAGWESDVSVIYAENGGIYIWFKRELEPYAEGYEDPPFEVEEGSVFSGWQQGCYRDEEPLRMWRFAIGQFYKEHPTAGVMPLDTASLDRVLSHPTMFSGKPFPFCERFFDEPVQADALWFPVTVADILVIDDSVVSYQGDSCIVGFDRNVQEAVVGGDSYMYMTDTVTEEGRFLNCWKRAPYTCACRAAEVPWIGRTYPFERVWFMRDSVLLPDRRCVDYNGQILENRTRHYQNVDALYTMRRLLADPRSKPSAHTLSLRLGIPLQMDSFTPEDVDRTLVPYLQSAQMLDEVRYNEWTSLCKLFGTIGAGADFFPMLLSVIHVERYFIHEHCECHICSEPLMRALWRLVTRCSSREMTALLCDIPRLIWAVAGEMEYRRVVWSMNDRQRAELKAVRHASKYVSGDRRFSALSEHTLVLSVSSDGARILAKTVNGRHGRDLVQVYAE